MPYNNNEQHTQKYMTFKHKDCHVDSMNMLDLIT